MFQAFNDCLADVEAHMKSTGNQIFIIATASDTSKVPAVLLSCFTNELVLKVGTLLIAYPNYLYNLRYTSYRLRLRQNDRV
jgi:hypothetical protein